MGWRTTLTQKVRIHDSLAREILAEFLGTYILLVIGDGSVAQVTLSEYANGDFLTINLAWFLAVTLGVYASGGVSGGHINPAVTLTFAVLGRFPWYKVLFYWLAQYVGALAGAATVYGVYIDALDAYDGGDRQTIGDKATAGIFATYPAPHLSNWSGFGDQVVGTAILLFAVMSLVDTKNMAAPKHVIPWGVGAAVGAVGMSFGFNCGYAINPARDLGPRIFTSMAGWGKEPFTVYDYWFWVPFVAPHIGAVVGAWFYNLMVGMHWPEELQRVPSLELKLVDNKERADYENPALDHKKTAGPMAIEDEAVAAF